MEIRTCVNLLQFNFEHLIKCFGEQERLLNLSDLLLKERAEDIIEGAIADTLVDEEIDSDNLQWIFDATNTYLRYFPENIIGSGLQILDEEIDQLYQNITKLNEAILKYIKEKTC